MDIEIVGEDPYGRDAYAKLFDEIMSDLNKAVLIDRVRLVLRPETPLFIFTIVLKAAPGPKTVGDIATVRKEVGGVHVTITEERYAPDILTALFNRYGRQGAEEEAVAGITITSGEEDRRELMGAVWRTMPEGIKNRKTMMTDNVITVVATEEILTPEMVAAGREEHVLMGGSADV